VLDEAGHVLAANPHAHTESRPDSNALTPVASLYAPWALADAAEAKRCRPRACAATGAAKSS
jgi:hypothetical protein